MAIRATVDHEGNDTVEQLIDTTGGHVSSTTYQAPEGSIEFVRGGFRDTTADASLLQDDDLVEVEGMQVRVDMARQMGLLGAAVQQPATEQPQQVTEEPPQANLSPVEQQLNEISNGLNASVESGTLNITEAQTYDTTMAQMALAGFDLNEAMDIAYKAAAGEQVEGVSVENRELAQLAYRTVHETAYNSAATELSSDDFTYLGEVMRNDPHARQAIEDYVLQRATGVQTVKWSEAVEQLREQINRV